MKLPKSKRAGLLVQNTDGEAVVYHQPSHRVHRLSRSAVLVWERCDGNTTVRQASDELSRLLGRPVQDEVVEFAVENLARAGLVETPAPMPPSRRSMLKSLGWTGAAAAMLPLVTTVLSPQPASAASVAADPCSVATGKPAGCPCIFKGPQNQCANGLVCVLSQNETDATCRQPS